MRTHTVVAVLTAIIPAAVQAQPLEPWSLPDPDAMVKASNTLCAEQGKTAIMAVLMRQEGRKLEEVLSLVPPAPRALSLRLVSAMRENVEDAFQYPDISQYTYYSFRSEVCFRETLGAVRMPRFSTVHAKIAECQKQHGGEKSTPLFKCVQAVVREATPL